jgi:hypothetical protein
MDPSLSRAFQTDQERDLKHLVWPMPLAQVLPHFQLIFLPKPGFLEFI